ncbi:MAG: acyl carrier protein [Halothiobacillaceae bacterium]|nr:MAG: acyl carrier protein [Halothiobacillaceae bacterium]
MHLGDVPPSASFKPSKDLEADLRAILHDALQLGDEAFAFNAETPLLGALPQLDSMGVLAVLTALEQQLGLQLHDDDIDASLFETFGSLMECVRRRLG